MLDLERRLERLTETLANKASRYAAHAGRKRLITKQDVLLTKRRVYRNPASFRPKARTTKSASISDM